jgi:hypothetical protein
LAVVAHPFTGEGASMDAASRWAKERLRREGPSYRGAAGTAARGLLSSLVAITKRRRAAALQNIGAPTFLREAKEKSREGEKEVALPLVGQLRRALGLRRVSKRS